MVTKVTEPSRRAGALYQVGKDLPPGTRIPKAIFALFADVIGATAAEVTKLHERLDAVEAAAMRYEGPHNPAKAYQPGAVVTRHGSLWLAAKGAAEGEVPGDGATGWRLIAKAGSAPR